MMKVTLPLVCCLVLLLFKQAQALSSDCTKVYPSEYAYHDRTVTRTERSTANCRRFPSGLQAGVFTEQYIRCDGTQLRLLDSDLGSDQYVAASYYEWPAETVPRQLLFTFPARVNLTTITLHYYSDTQRGLPLLRFTAVPDDFDIWDASLGKYNNVDVVAQPPAGGNKAGSRSVSVGLKWNTRKILMIKAGAGFILSVSEVQFFVCNATPPQVSPEGITLEPTENELLKTTTIAMENSTLAVSNVSTVQTSEVVAWVLVSILTVLCTAELVALVLMWLHKRRQVTDSGNVTRTRVSRYDMRGNPCYKTTISKNTAVVPPHDYESMRVDG